MVSLRTVFAVLALTTLGACTATPSFVLREDGSVPEESTNETTPLAPTPPAHPGADPAPSGEGGGGGGESSGGGGAPNADAGTVDAGGGGNNGGGNNGGGNNGNDAGKGKGKDKDKD